jgi:hypothetical protein
MSTINNIYGGKVLIPFADFGPDTVFTQLEGGSVVAIDAEFGLGRDFVHSENFGIFSKEGYEQILREHEAFKQEYTWIPSIWKWLPNEMVDKT